MAIKRSCDRCGAEINPTNSATYVNVRSAFHEESPDIELCCSCAMQIRECLKPVRQTSGEYTFRSVGDDLERKLDETGKLVPRLYGDYVFSPCQNAFNGKTSWWLSKKDCTVAIYCFTAGTTAEVDAQLSVGGGQAYIQMFEERTGGRNAGC